VAVLSLSSNVNNLGTIKQFPGSLGQQSTFAVYVNADHDLPATGTREQTFTGARSIKTQVIWPAMFSPSAWTNTVTNTSASTQDTRTRI